PASCCRRSRYEFLRAQQSPERPRRDAAGALHLLPGPGRFAALHLRAVLPQPLDLELLLLRLAARRDPRGGLGPGPPPHGGRDPDPGLLFPPHPDHPLAGGPATAAPAGRVPGERNLPGLRFHALVHRRPPPRDVVPLLAHT